MPGILKQCMSQFCCVRLVVMLNKQINVLIAPQRHSVYTSEKSTCKWFTENCLHIYYYIFSWDMRFDINITKNTQFIFTQGCLFY